MLGSFLPINLKSDPLRKNLGFEILATKIDEIIDKNDISKVVFERRGDITRFNYYLNRDKNKHQNIQGLEDIQGTFKFEIYV